MDLKIFLKSVLVLFQLRKHFQIALKIKKTTNQPTFKCKHYLTCIDIIQSLIFNKQQFYSTGTIDRGYSYGSASGFSHVSPLRFAKQRKKQNQTNQTAPTIRRRELWEALGKGVGGNLYISTCLCFPADQRVFHQGAEETLPEEQRHGRLLFHLELRYDHSKSGRAPVPCCPWPAAIDTVLSPHPQLAEGQPASTILSHQA